MTIFNVIEFVRDNYPWLVLIGTILNYIHSLIKGIRTFVPLVKIIINWATFFLYPIFIKIVFVSAKSITRLSYRKFYTLSDFTIIDSYGKMTEEEKSNLFKDPNNKSQQDIIKAFKSRYDNYFGGFLVLVLSIMVAATHNIINLKQEYEAKQSVYFSTADGFIKRRINESHFLKQLDEKMKLTFTDPEILALTNSNLHISVIEVQGSYYKFETPADYFAIRWLGVYKNGYNVQNSDLNELYNFHKSGAGLQFNNIDNIYSKVADYSYLKSVFFNTERNYNKAILFTNQAFNEFCEANHYKKGRILVNLSQNNKDNIVPFKDVYGRLNVYLSNPTIEMKSVYLYIMHTNVCSKSHPTIGLLLTASSPIDYTKATNLLYFVAENIQDEIQEQYTDICYEATK